MVVTLSIDPAFLPASVGAGITVLLLIRRGRLVTQVVGYGIASFAAGVYLCDYADGKLHLGKLAAAFAVSLVCGVALPVVQQKLPMIIQQKFGVQGLEEKNDN